MKIKAATVVIPAALLLLVTTGRQRVVDAAPPADGGKQEARLTLNAARTALIAMIEKQPDYKRDFLGLPALKAGKGLEMGDDKDGVTEGTWGCHLKQKTFLFVRPTGQAGVFSCSGVFEQVQGKWVARIEREQHAH